MPRRASRPGGRGLFKEPKRPTAGGELERGAWLGGTKMRGGPGMPLV